MNPKIAQKLSAAHFKRRFGVHRATFKRLVKALKPYWRPTPKPGVKPKLALGDRVLVCLEYWREYRTYFHIGSSWGVSEATVYRIVRSRRGPSDVLWTVSLGRQKTIAARIWQTASSSNGCDPNAN